MGLDLALGVIILIAAFRGWFQGFIGQAVRIAEPVACVYLADRVRDYARPYVTAVPVVDRARPGRPIVVVGFCGSHLHRARGRSRWWLSG